MAKLRHIALIVPYPDKAAKFFEEAFDMKVAGRARRGVYVSDGTINVALLKQEGAEKVGIYHFGMWVDDLDQAEKQVQGAGATYLEGRPTSPDSFYECKYKDPLGIIFDLTHKGWKGAVKDVVAKNYRSTPCRHPEARSRDIGEPRRTATGSSVAAILRGP